MNGRWPVEAGLGRLVCNGASACYGVTFPEPDPVVPYTVDCAEDSECRNARIYCPTNASCTINCAGKNSCRSVSTVSVIFLAQLVTSDGLQINRQRFTVWIIKPVQ